MKSDTSNITLMIFTCEGREHMLPDTIESFRKTCDYSFNSTILAIDGVYSSEAITVVNPDLIVQNYNRKGYIQNILNALNLIETEFFFWLEDDWKFTQEVDLHRLIEELKQNPDWVQIRLSKTAPLSLEEQKNLLSDKIYKSIYGFSANPCLCRTDLVIASFRALEQDSRNEELGFEEFVSMWFDTHGFTCAVLDPSDALAIDHMGYLESTPRQWHMTASLDGKSNKYLSGMRGQPSPPFWRRLLMIFKLAYALLNISTKQLWSRAAYDLAFRIVAISKRVNEEMETKL